MIDYTCAKTLVQIVKQIPGAKILSIACENTGFASFDINNSGKVGYAPEHPVTLEAMLMGTMYSGGGMIVRQMLNSSVMSKTADGIDMMMPRKNLYGVTLKDDKWSPLTPEMVEQLHCTCHETGLKIEAEPEVLFASLQSVIDALPDNALIIDPVKDYHDKYGKPHKNFMSGTKDTVRLLLKKCKREGVTVSFVPPLEVEDIICENCDEIVPGAFDILYWKSVKVHGHWSRPESDEFECHCGISHAASMWRANAVRIKGIMLGLKGTLFIEDVRSIA